MEDEGDEKDLEDDLAAQYEANIRKANAIMRSRYE